MTDSKNKSLWELYQKPLFLLFLCFLVFIFHISIPFFARFSAESLANAFDLMIVTAASLLAIPALLFGLFSISVGDLYEKLSSLYDDLNCFQISEENGKHSSKQTKIFKIYERSLIRYSAFFKAKEKLPVLIPLIWGSAILLFVFSASITALKSFPLGSSLTVLTLLLSILLYLLYDFFYPVINSLLPNIDSLPTIKYFLEPFSGNHQYHLSFLTNNLFFVAQRCSSTLLIPEQKRQVIISLFSPLKMTNFILTWEITDNKGNRLNENKNHLIEGDQSNKFMSSYNSKIDFPDKTDFPLQVKVVLRSLNTKSCSLYSDFYEFKTEIPQSFLEVSGAQFFYIRDKSGPISS